MADNTTELEVLNQIVDVLGGQSGQYETVVPTLQQIRDLLSGGGGGGGGYNPSLSVGRADALTGVDSTAQWATRESTGSGAATVRSVQGAAVAWNQLVGSDTSSVTVPSGHKYLGIIGGASAIATSDGTAVSVTGGTDQLFDLTAMFGAGNEPATVAEFERMYPEAYYPYSAPTLKPVQIAGIQSKDANGNELDNVSIPVSTYFPNGMYGLSDARDELTATEAITRVGFLDLGTVTWVKGNALTDGTGVVFWAGGASLPSAVFASAMILSTAWTKRALPLVWESLSKGQYLTLNSNIVVGGDSSLTAQQFKQSMSGIMLAYALATPTTQPISPALPMTYRVQTGGSESVIVPDGEISAAPVLTVAEGESAASLVMDALAAIAAPDGPTATANHSVGTYLTMGGKLYKVTSAIAVGESITPNTNVSETTVMAELIARTA